MSPRALLLAGGVLTAGCASAPPAPPPAPAASGPSASCLLATDSTGPTRTITAAFDDPADARRARLAATVDAPVRLDCEGHPLPGLAVAWSRDTSGKFWTLELGEPSASDSIAHWTAAALAATWRADPDANAALEWGGVQSLVPLDARRLVVGFSAPVPELPPLFADRALGVARGEGPAGLEPAAPGRDLRDAVDRGADLIHTGDPDLLDYARQRPGLTEVPLPWSRSYLLVLPARSPGVGTAVPADTATFRAGLARDAVRTDARVPEAPFWWEQRDACVQRPAPAAGREPLNAIAYPAADRVARDLAERIVALAGAAELTARGLPADSFAAALRGGSARAFVVAVPRHAAVACRETAGWPPRVTVVPLIETRPHAVVRRGAPPLVVEWDGALRAADARERPEATP
jgi:hypothetical protein